MNCEDTDPVIKEIPVYLAKGLTEQLSVFQYPLRSSRDGYNEAEFLKTLIKPNKQEVQIELALNINSENYDVAASEQIMMNIEKSGKGGQDEESKIFPNNYVDRIILKSSQAVPKYDKFAIAVYQDGELHITPLKSILQIRPDFSHLDANEKRNRDDAKSVEDDEDDADGPKQVNVSFVRNLSDHVKRLREQSFAHQSQNCTEQFINAQYHTATTTKAELTRLKMFCQAMENSAYNFNCISRREYLNMIAPLVEDDKHNRAEVPDTSSLNYISTLTNIPLLDHIRVLIKRAKILSFAQLRSIIPLEHETDLIAKYLQQVAILVQGNWVVNSELEYPKDSKSFHSGIPAELMCRARDYILLLFTEHEYVDRKAISLVIKLPDEEIREILVNLAKHQPEKGWRLIIPPTKDFIERYPRIMERQEKLWDFKRNQLRESMKNQTHTSQRQRRRSNKESACSENEERISIKGKNH